MLKATNISTVPQRSPLRYPGGKTWLIPQVRQWLWKHGGVGRTLVEPFAGGGIVTLTAIMEQLVDTAIMIEKDESVGAVWQAILGRSGRRLAEQIRNFEFTRENVTATMCRKPHHLRDRAFQTILRNRVRRNGILADGAGLLKLGEAGSGLASRWYPDTLADRVLDIVQVRHKIEITIGDGLRYIEKHKHCQQDIYFIDPPYSEVGKRLYRYGAVNHETLFECVSNLAGHFLMTYKDTSEIRDLVTRYAFECQPIEMRGGLNNTKMELLISPDFSWLRTQDTVNGDFGKGWRASPCPTQLKDMTHHARDNRAVY